MEKIPRVRLAPEFRVRGRGALSGRVVVHRDDIVEPGKEKRDRPTEARPCPGDERNTAFTL